MEGWIKVHRKILDKPIWQLSTPEQKTILITLLLMANHDHCKWEWQGKPYECGAGQFITSLDGIVKKCGKGITLQNVRTALKRFENLEFLTNESTKTGRLLSIVNWGDYQLEEDKPNIDTNKDLTKTQQRPNKDLTPNKNVKNVKNIKKNSPKEFSDESFERKCVDYLINSIKAEMPNAKVPELEDGINKWCEFIEKMVRIDEYSEDDIYKTLVFARTDSFWKLNIRSTSKFRDKFETLYLQSKNKKTPKIATSTNKFNNFPQRDYASNMTSIESKLLERSKQHG